MPACRLQFGSLEKQAEQLRRQEIDLARQRKEINDLLAGQNFKSRSPATAIAHSANTSRKLKPAATLNKRLLFIAGAHRLSG
jgi:septal ring factor EnvC (AmiA/AmiB activator)